MGKYDWVREVSVDDRIIMLVDELAENENAGVTKDLEKIEYNCSLLGPEVGLEASFRLLLTQAEGISTVFGLGRYIVWLQLAKDERRGSMLFTDHSISGSDEQLRAGVLRTVSDEVAERWLTIRGQMRISYSPIEDNIIRLVKA
ncbi:hypothetical protein GCM10028805_47160 [Spirosoma harenae]